MHKLGGKQYMSSIASTISSLVDDGTLSAEVTGTLPLDFQQFVLQCIDDVTDTDTDSQHLTEQPQPQSQQQQPHSQQHAPLNTNNKPSRAKVKENRCALSQSNVTRMYLFV
jgi:hypothetical protein